MERVTMSMNLHVSATLAADTKLGPKEITEHFDLWQTPTDDTYAILEQPDPHAAYVAWVHARYSGGPTEYCTQEMLDDIKDSAEWHLEELGAWMEHHVGWHIEWYYL
jgi:hypothetical protein